MADTTFKTPKAGEKTGPQAQIGGDGFAGTDVQLSGFGAVQKATYKVYREINKEPTVALAQAIVKGPIIRAPWSWESDPNSPTSRKAKRTKAQLKAAAGGGDEDPVQAERKQFLEDMFRPGWSRLIRDILHALDMGWAGFEQVWDSESGKWVMDWVKPLAWEKTQILGDGGGRFAGLENKSGDKTVKLAKTNSFLFTNDPICGDLYGSPRNENIRKWWSRGIEVADEFARYLKKVSAIIFQLHYPDGTSKDAAGADRPNYWLAGDLLEKVQRGESVAIPNKFASFLGASDGNVTPAELEKALASAGKSDWMFSFLAPPTSNHAEAYLSTFGYLDKLYFRGWLRPERAGLEATHGGMGHGDSSAHNEVGLNDGESIAWNVADAISRGPVNDVLEANYGKQARDTIWVEPGALIDKNSEALSKVVLAGLADPNVGPQLSQYIDWKGLFEDVDVPVFAAMTQDGITLLPPSVVDATKQPEKPIEINTTPATAKPKKPSNTVKTLSAAAVKEARRQLMRDGSDVLEMSGADDGHWVTIDGEHVFIGKGGMIEKGPAHLVGKKPSELGGDKQLVSGVQLFDARKIIPLHPVNEPTKLKAIQSSMKERGWTGRPVLAVENDDGKPQGLTGSHRVVAARRTGTPIPTLLVTQQQMDDAGLDADFLKSTDDEDKEYKLRKAGLTQAADLMQAEIDEDEKTGHKAVGAI